MARHFSEAERAAIEKALLAAAKELFIRYGVNKTTISDITEMAGVGKGTFYHFFKSKGDIFMKLYEQEWRQIHDSLDEEHRNRKGALPDLMLDYIYENRTLILEHPLLSITYSRHTLSLISEEPVIARLVSFRDLAATRLQGIIVSWIESNGLEVTLDPAVISGMMRSLTYLNYHKDEIGEDIFEDVIRQLAEGITLAASHKPRLAETDAG